MADGTGGSDSQGFINGEEVHLGCDRQNQWFIKSYDVSWPQRDGFVSALITATVPAQNLSWEDLRFKTKDEAYAFVWAQWQSGKAPGAKALYALAGRRL